ncbi:MAG: YbhB/YbcL family Raf kinase inhibitor-like protein [Candidatus Paceibacteria bacterium]
MKQVITIIGLGLLAAASVMILDPGAVNDAVNGPMDEQKLTLTSSAFADGGAIPTRYTCDGENISPPLSISNVPEGTKTLVLVMDDPDIPQVFKDERGIDSFDHWVMYSIDPDTAELAEGATHGAEGLNGSGNAGYTGPCPPTEYEPTEHRYIFKLYALKGSLQFVKAPTKAEVLAALSGMKLGEAMLVGTYDRAR